MPTNDTLIKLYNANHGKEIDIEEVLSELKSAYGDGKEMEEFWNNETNFLKSLINKE